MKPYRIWLFAESAVALPKPLEVSFTDATVTVGNHSKQIAGDIPPVHVGLQYEVRLSAESSRLAMEHAHAAAGHVNNLLSFAHSASVGDPTPLLAIDVDPSSPDRELTQRETNLPLGVRPHRVFRHERFDLLFGRWESFVASSEDGVRDRVARAINLLRRSSAETDVVDQFEDAWDGLEAVNPLLIAKYSLATSFPGGKCDNCGATMQITGSSSGIRYAVRTLLGKDQPAWKALYAVRQDVVHGREGYGVLLPKLKAVLPDARYALIAAIGDLIGIPADRRSEFMRQPLAVPEGGEVVVVATLEDLSVQALDQSESLPHLQVRFEEVARSGELGEEGEKRLTFRLTYRMMNFTGKHTIDSAELRVPSDPDAQKGMLELSDVRVLPAPNVNLNIPSW